MRSNLTFKPKLSKSERKLIRKIAEIQLASLTRILTNKMEEMDLTTHCFESQISEAILRKQVRQSFDQFSRVLTEAPAFFDLDYDNMSISRALIMGTFSTHKGKRKLWKKIRVVEQFTFSLN